MSAWSASGVLAPPWGVRTSRNGSAQMSTLKALGVAVTLTFLSLAMMPGGSVLFGNF